MQGKTETAPKPVKAKAQSDMPWRFQPGKSGNPSGRPKIANNIREIARDHTETAIRALVEVVEDKDHPQRVAAANALLDRGYGKPIQQHDVSVDFIGNMNIHELRAYISGEIEDLGLGNQAIAPSRRKGAARS